MALMTTNINAINIAEIDFEKIIKKLLSNTFLQINQIKKITATK